MRPAGAHRSLDVIRRSSLMPLLACLPVLALLNGGCLEILTAIRGVEAGDEIESPPEGGSDTEPDGDTSEGVPVVSLRVSNPSPQPNETVTLTCTLTAGSADGVTFEFEPALRVSHSGGSATARFTPTESDIDVQFSFTCRGTNEFGTGSRSNTVNVIPSL
jgi:hypothetical protein